MHQSSSSCSAHALSVTSGPPFTATCTEALFNVTCRKTPAATRCARVTTHTAETPGLRIQSAVHQSAVQQRCFRGNIVPPRGQALLTSLQVTTSRTVRSLAAAPAAIRIFARQSEEDPMLGKLTGLQTQGSAALVKSLCLHARDRNRTKEHGVCTTEYP